MSSPAYVPATPTYIQEIPADSQEIGPYTAEIAACIGEIGTYMKEIAGYSPETRIAFMESTPDWSEIATDTTEAGNYRKKMAGITLETAAHRRVIASNHQETNGLCRSAAVCTRRSRATSLHSSPAGQLVLPNPQHPPADLAQRPRHPPVPGLIACELRAPERRVALRLRGMARARVPETPVHEHRQPQLGEDEVGPDGELRVGS